MKFIFLCLYCFLCLFAGAQLPAPSEYKPMGMVNYIRTWDAQAADTSNANITTSTALDRFSMTTQYLDGLGRPIQTVAKGITPLGKDFVTGVEYDPFGREQVSYLPFGANNTLGNNSLSDGLFKINPFQQDSSFSKAQYAGENYFYSQRIFEASPLNRVQASYAPGDNWIGSSRGVSSQFLFNSLLDSVRIWTAGATASDVPTTASVYAADLLFKNIITDEHGKQVIEYKDLDGKVILKKVQLATTPSVGPGGWLCTYYVYDDFGNLRFVLQPRAVELLLSSGNWNISTSIRDELCFYYGYDSRNRLTIKKVPGAGEVWMVYDKRDRLSMTQDANLRQSPHQWMVTIYDNLNRPQFSGLWTDYNDRSYHESQAIASANDYYPFNAEPTSNWVSLTATGYDDYTTLPLGAPSGSLDNTYINGTNFITTYNASPDYATQVLSYPAVKGMVTWAKVKILGTTSTFLYTTNIYDEKSRVIQVKSTNLSGGTDIATSQYSFSGKLIRGHMFHQKSGTNAANYLVLTKNAYDIGGRLTSIKKVVNGGAEKTVSQLTYDELGQLKTRKLAAEYNSGAGLETLTYDYNIRGWLLGANRDYAKSTSSTSNYFGFDLGYDKTAITPTGGSSLGNYSAAQYNGNIGGTVWKSKGDGEIRKYDFSYDAVNRFTAADFNQYTSGFNKNAGLDFSVSNLTYDANGNILTQNQKGWKISGSNYIDQLSYSYQASSNKLQGVLDASNDTSSRLGDFKYNPNTKTSTDYNYDGNGNLILDNNKKISSITYNHLNLPSVITVANKGTITYTYDAAGNKLKKQVVEGSKTTTTLYLYGNYVNDTLQFLPQEEGRIRPKTDGSYAYDYFLKDHLGNVRMVLTDEQKTDAYPPASMETAQSSTEDSLYSNIENTRYARLSISGYPTTDTYTNPNDYVAKTNGSGNKIGPAMVLKVMAGDKFNLRVSSWYKLNGSTPRTPASVLNDLISAMTNSIGAVSSKATSSDLFTNGTLNTPAQSFLNTESSYTTTKPKAFLNWILLDEQFKFVSSSSGFSQVGNDTMFTVHQFNNLNVDKNGYLYVYVSNETPNIDVFFDNLQVTHIRGNELEENHYYPFGLIQQGISSTAAGSTQNKKKYNGIDLQNDLGLNEYDAQLRELDPQIGRWWQIDPVTNGYENLSPYASMYNDPIKINDPFGNEGENCCSWNDIFVAAKTFIYGSQATYNAVVEKSTDFVKSSGKQLASSTKIVTTNVIKQALAEPISMVDGTGEAKIVSEALGAKSVVEATETVQRAMSKAELKDTKETGLLRGGREGTHYVSDAIGNDAKRVQQRLALGQKPEVKVTMEVPAGQFSKATKVDPAKTPDGNILPGGGSERTGTGNIPVKIIKEKELKNGN
jgi:RHS repeat-associated protein